MADDVGGAGRQLVSSSSMLNGSNWLRYQQIKLRLFWGTVDFMILFFLYTRWRQNRRFSRTNRTRVEND